MQQDKFSFQRSRGIVWVCDLADSSKLFNENATAAELEVFLPRLHWLGRVVVEAAGGTFLKWTGDGFLAWFETPLHRELAQKAQSLFEAVWHLTVTVNLTQLGASPDKKFRLRHGVAYEHDALLTTITHSPEHKTLDITGRAVVLAFRLSGVRAAFPCLVTDVAVAKAAKEGGFGHIHFKAWLPNSEDLLRYFKGERWGTRSLAMSVERKPRVNSIQSAIKKTKKLISKLESNIPERLPSDNFSVQYTNAMSHGPQWAKDVLAEEARYLKDDLLGALKEITKMVSEKSSATTTKKE